jgi:adenylosuccinate synthase
LKPSSSAATPNTTRSLVIVGAQWGDEGKGKLVDLFASRAERVVRFQGGTNAGHTLVVDGRKTVLHLVPSGILHPGVVCAIGPGCVVDPEALVRELDGLNAMGVLSPPERLRVSSIAPLILPVHRALDQAREQRAGAARLGTTGRGIGPAYEDAVARRAVRLADAREPEHLRGRIEALLFEKNMLLQVLGAEPQTVEAQFDAVVAGFARLEHHLADVGAETAEALERGAFVVFEGAQGTLLDISHGTYPYVTSSSTVAASAATSLGLGMKLFTEVLGVSKAYCTRVGGGPFPTEMEEPLGTKLREAGQEFGATTGRPRRCGWLDLPALRLSARLNGMTALALMKIDVLRGIGPLQLCVAHHWRGQRWTVPPAEPAFWRDARPELAEVPGFDADLRGARSLDALPGAARDYLARIADEVGVPLRLVSVGPGRDENIVLDD